MHQLIDVLNLKILNRRLDILLQSDLTKILRSPTVQANLPGASNILLRSVVQGHEMPELTQAVAEVQKYSMFFYCSGHSLSDFCVHQFLKLPFI